MPQALLDRLSPEFIERFTRDLDRLIASDACLGLAVSGGPDSVAMLLLAAKARPGQVTAATVDHGLRPETGEEAKFVADLCASIGIPHTILEVEWAEKPTSAVQERARTERYASLSRWASESPLDAVLTAHHRDDQVETLIMRLNRGSGVTGLAGIRPFSRSVASVPIIRPLLEWSRGELAAVCAAAFVSPIGDPSNENEQFERVRIRHALAAAHWVDGAAWARSAAHLAAADDALSWAAEAEWLRATRTGDLITYSPREVPAEIRRRLVRKAILSLASEGDDTMLRGQEVDRVLEALEAGSIVTLRGVLCRGGADWTFSLAPRRRA